MYEKIKTKDDYDLLLKSGMFFELHPELSGNWEKDKRIISEIQTITVNNSFCETWTCTNQLRWKQVECNIGNGTSMNINELQQLWRSDIGSEKWEAVPFVL